MLVQIAILILIGVCILAISTLYARSRMRECLRPIEIADKDKSQPQDIRSELSPRRLAAQTLVTLGGLCVMATFYPSDKVTPKWSTIILLLVIGVGLLFTGVQIAKPRQSRLRPRYWRAALWGMACSASVLLFSICAIFVVRTPREDIPWWLWEIMALLVVVGLFSAIACVAAGLVALIRSKRDKGVEDQTA